jgi:hypothetical protein
VKIIGGLAEDLSLDIPEDDVGACLVAAISEESSSTAAWTIDVFVRLAGAGRFKLGRMTTTPPSGGANPPSRVVFVACCPGAMGWSATAEGPAGAQAEIVLATGDAGAASSPVGVTKVVY